MMKSRIRKTCLFLLSAALLLSALLGTGALAADYDYTIRVYAGTQGTLDGKQEVATHISHGKPYKLDLDELNVKLTDSKYYAKGLMVAGHESDGNDLFRSKTFTSITEDRAYVVVYGIKADLVAYTVRYMDANNKVLLPQDTYYGAVGEKPIVSFRYVEGYQPTAYNETKTLSSKASDNVFTFRYTPVKQTVNTVVVNQGTTTSTGNNGQTATNNQTNNQSNTQNAQTGNTNTQRTNNQAAANQTTDNPNTQELVDLDKQEVPLASGEDIKDVDTKTDNETASANHGLRSLLNARNLIIAGTSLALLLILIALLVGRRKKTSV